MIRTVRLLAGALLVLAFTAGNGEAQRRPHFRATAGVNFARWHGSDVAGGVKTRTALFGGALVDLDLSPAFTLESGAYYSQEGTGADAGGGITGTAKVDYLRIPLLLRAGTTLQGTTPIHPFLYAGPGIGFRVRCRVEASSGSVSAEADCNDPNVQLKLKSVDFGLHFGGGVEVGRVELGARYQLGLSSIDDSGANADVKNGVVALTAGYRF